MFARHAMQPTPFAGSYIALKPVIESANVVREAALQRAASTPKSSRSRPSSAPGSSSRLPPLISYHYHRCLVQVSLVCTPLPWNLCPNRGFEHLSYSRVYEGLDDGFFGESIRWNSCMSTVLVVSYSCRHGVLSQGVSRVTPYSHHHYPRWVDTLLISTLKNTLQRQGWVE